MRRFILVIFVIAVIPTLVVFGLTREDQETIEKDLDVSIFEEDTIRDHFLENFIWDNTTYKVKIHSLKLSNPVNNKNILVSEHFLKQKKEHQSYLKERLDRECIVVVETNKPPYVILNLLNIGMEEVFLGDFYPQNKDIGAFGIKKIEDRYSVGYARLNGVAKNSKEYYNTLLRGFIDLP
jgi:hypothetical protein